MKMRDFRERSIPYSYPLRESVFVVASRIILAQTLIAIASLLMTWPLFIFRDSIDSVIPTIILYGIMVIILQGINMLLIMSIVLDWATTVYILRRNEIVIQKGVWKIREDVCSVEHVAEVEVRQSLMGRVFNFGTVKVYNPALMTDVYLENIPNPYAYAQVIQHKESKDTVRFFNKRELPI